ncbi:MAG: FAD:protein FMN transferase [Lachnospiraceae bacterium]|nr:FAD:protein FMN transferase [Lachnospiraceae bacterium]
MKKVICYLLAMLLPVLAVTGCGAKTTSEEQLVSKSGFYFDTSISLQIYSEQGEALLEKCFSLCAELEKTFSRTLETSELYKVNHRSSDTVEVSDDLAKVIRVGLDYGDLSDGVLDITIAPVTDLWDFKSQEHHLPAEADIQAALAKVDYKKVHLDGTTLTFDSPDTMLDLGAVAKGYCADRLKEYLTSQGVKSGLINLGGNVLTLGSKPDGSDWNVGIQKPFADRGVVERTVSVTDKSVVSSGIYERYFELDGVLYHHVLDPATGYPVKTDLAETTIVTDASVYGDAMSTICLLKGKDGANAFIEKMKAQGMDINAFLTEE